MKTREPFSDLAMACENCGWRGVYADLAALGSVGRISCPKCTVDTGPGGVVPCDQAEWQRRLDAFEARRKNAAEKKRGGA